MWVGPLGELPNTEFFKSCSMTFHLPNKTLIFHDFQGPTMKFHEFPGFENEILKFHDFPGFPWPVRILEQVTDNLAFTFSYSCRHKTYSYLHLLSPKVWMLSKLVLKAHLKASHHFPGNNPFKSDSLHVLFFNGYYKIPWLKPLRPFLRLHNVIYIPCH